MAYEISFDDRHGIAEIRFFDQTLHADHIRARTELLELCRARNAHKLLIDARELAGAPSTIQLFDFAESWDPIAQETPLEIAGVLPRDPAVRQWWRFGETVGLNRGLHSRAFDSRDDAAAWLCKE